MKSVLFILKIVMLTIFLTTISCSNDNLVVFPQEQYAEDIFVNEDGSPTSVSSKDVDDIISKVCGNTRKSRNEDYVVTSVMDMSGNPAIFVVNFTLV